jgi:hypothetical protein
MTGCNEIYSRHSKGRLGICIEDPGVVEKILTHLAVSVAESRP